MKLKIETGLLICAMLGFWGMLYPDLCFTEDICSVVYQTEDGSEEMPEEDLFLAISSAAPGQIRVKSRLLEFIIGKKETNRERKEDVSRQ